MRLFLAALLLVLCAWAAPAQARIAVTDLAGRAVVLDAPARRIVIGSSLNLDALALAHPDPTGLVVGWSGLSGGLDESQASAIRTRFPALDAVPLVGRMSLDTLSVETVLGLSPDLVLLNFYDLAGAPGPLAAHPLILRLEAAGLKVAVVDFFVDPLAHSTQSLRVLGSLFGTETRVEAFVAFYEAHLAAIDARLSAPSIPRPRVFMHAHAAGRDCCFSPGQGALDGLIRRAGGHNLGADLLPGATGQVPLETLLVENPDVYIATGGYAHGSASGFTLGRGISPEDAQAGFGRLLAQPGLSAVGAIGAGRAHGLWHDFTHSPLHLLAVEVMAKWLHPDLFADIDPEQTRSEINEYFTAFPLEGTFWVDAPQ